MPSAAQKPVGAELPEHTNQRRAVVPPKSTRRHDNSEASEQKAVKPERSQGSPLNGIRCPDCGTLNGLEAHYCHECRKYIALLVGSR